MKKKISSIVLAGILSLSTLVSCSKPTQNEVSLEWLNYIESDVGYVYDYYSYVTPSVIDQNGEEYEVSVSVKDSADKPVDNMGSMFLISSESEYTITFTAYDGTKTHTKETKVQGVEKAVYTLLDPNLIYEVGETVNLDGKVQATKEGEISYNVSKDGNAVALTNNTFVPTESGLYTVTAKLSQQPNYDFSLLIVEAGKYSSPNGLITDRADASAFSIETKNIDEDETLPLTGLSTLGYSETEKFAGVGNGSVKVSVNYPEGSAKFETNISYKPEFPKSYYESLKNMGYRNVAIRLKIVEGVDTIDYYGVYFGTKLEHVIINEIGQEKMKATDVALWSGPGWEFGKYGWTEILIPMDYFLESYAEQMNLFSFRCSKGRWGSVEIYIDNVYAVKPIGGESSFAQVELGASLNLSDIALTDSKDIDKKIVTATFNGANFKAQEENIFSNEGVYKFIVRAQNRYGLVKIERATFDVNEVVAKLNSTMGVSASIAKCNGLPDGNATEFAFDTNMPYKGNSGTVKFTMKTRNMYSDIFVDPVHDKAYYEGLKADGYQYVTVRLYTNEDSLFITEGKSWITHYNTFKDLAPESMKAYYIEDGTLTPFYYLGNWGIGTGWFEISIPIDVFLDNFDENSTAILRVWNMYYDEQSFWIEGVYATKDGKVNGHYKEFCIDDYDAIGSDKQWE